MSGGGIRVARNVSAGAVAAIAAWSSYSHMVHVAMGYHERPQVAYALPFSVDGMLIVASVVMVDDKRRVGRVRPIARLAFTAGMVASIAANIAAAYPSIGARIVDAWPALALLLVVEMLARPPASATEVPPVPATGSQLRAARPAQPPHLPVGALLPPSAVARPGAVARPATATQPPAQVTAGQRLYPSGIRQAGSPGHTAAVSLPDLHEQTQTQSRPAPKTREPVGEVPPAARGHARHDGAEVSPLQQVPPRHTVPPLQQIPPAGTTAEVPAEAGPPQRTSSAPRKRRNETADCGGAGPRRSHHGSAGGGGRRPTAVTLELARQIIDAEPDLPRTEIATRLGVSTRRLREVLATAA